MHYMLDVWTDDGAKGTIVIAVNASADGKGRVFGWKIHTLFSDGGYFEWSHNGDGWTLNLYQQGGNLRIWLLGPWNSLPNSSSAPPEPWFDKDSNGFGGTMEKPGTPGLLGPAIHWKMK